MREVRLKTFEKGIPYTVALPIGIPPTRSLQLIRDEDARKMDLPSDAAVIILRGETPQPQIAEVVQDICRRYPIASEMNIGVRLPNVATATGIIELDGVALKGGNVLVSIYTSQMAG